MQSIFTGSFLATYRPADWGTPASYQPFKPITGHHRPPQDVTPNPDPSRGWRASWPLQNRRLPPVNDSTPSKNWFHILGPPNGSGAPRYGREDIWLQTSPPTDTIQKQFLTNGIDCILLARSLRRIMPARILFRCNKNSLNR
jgi:hypothetical protein